MRQAGEPSVEEILESIKKVIARDNRAEAAQLRQRREGPGVVTTSRVGAPPAPGFTAPADGAEADVLDLADAAEVEGDEPTLDQAGEADWGDGDEDERGDAPAGNASEPPLVAASAAASMRESLAALAVLAEPGAAPQIVRSGETSLEGLTRELLRPMLAEWLEKNLPAMVERMVAAEIARIAGKKR